MPAVIYTLVRQQQLDLILVPATGKIIYRSIPDAARDQLIPVIIEFISEITQPRKRHTRSYLPTAQQLYQWIIAPLEADLEGLSIDTIMFAMDTGLRSVPIAALHDGEQFLVEKYGLGLIPSVNLTDMRYRRVNNAQVLAMGASEFTDQTPLPSVPIELSVITGTPNLTDIPSIGVNNFTLINPLWSGVSFLNQDFTLENLKKQRDQHPFEIIHLATHGDFQPGNINNSYIQLWNQRLSLSQMRQLEWYKEPPVELLVLSACRTAIGDANAELGFAGLAVQTGAKSALASLWYVSDVGTLGLMTEFYGQLKQQSTKVQALQQAQIALLRGDLVIEGNWLKMKNGAWEIQLPPNLTNLRDLNLKHPYFWSGFTLIGSPW